MKYLHVLCCLMSVGFTIYATAEESPIIPPDAAIEVVSTGGYSFVEGPALAPDGSIYFSDIPNNSIHRYDPATGETTLFTDDSGGANGLMFLPHEKGLVACAGKARALHFYPGVFSRHNLDESTNKWTESNFIISKPFTDSLSLTHFDDKRLNSPNDLAVIQHRTLKRSVYFTDPRYGNRDGMEQDVEGVYVHHYSVSDGKTSITRIIDDLVRPNGIGLSPDDQTLYVNDNGDQKIWAYPILEPGKVGEGRLLNDLADLGGPDGMTVGPMGNIYTTIYGKGVLILSPDGQRLGFLDTGPQTTNCVFGADGKTLYVTAEKSLKRVVLNTGVE